MKIKRIFAYIIDYLIVSFLATLLFTYLPIFKNDYNNFVNTTEEYLETITTSGSSEIDDDYVYQYSYDISKSTVALTTMKCGLAFLYFGVVAYLCNGQTLGKKIFKIKVVASDNQKLNPNLFMLRTLIITNTIPTMIEIICTMYLSKSNWLLVYNITSYISEFIIFIILGFMIFRDDEKGLHDLICKTTVIETKKN